MSLQGFKKFNFNFAEIILNNSCPLDCSYCFLHNQGKEEKMTSETLKKIFEFLIETQRICPKEYIHVLLSLKEPLMSWDILYSTIKEYINILYKNEIYITITTNGVLLDDEKILFFRKNGICLNISLDGPQDIHDRDRIFRNKDGESSWKKIMDIIKKYPYEEGWTFCATVHKKDIDKIQEIFTFMSNLPIKCWVYGLDNNDNWDEESLERLEN